MVAFTKSSLCVLLMAIIACLLSGSAHAAPAANPSESLQDRLSDIGFQACPSGPQISLRPVKYVNNEFAQLFVQNDPDVGALYTWTLDLLRPKGTLIVSPSGVVSLNGTLPAPAILAFTVTATPITIGQIRTDSFSIEIK
ncbi:hypothetical protein HDU87_002782 [Geranomyces variabilis]|uniref:Uncharacterized protein n=1 Tax=Geranomyces variabilis TaxID=109894 RepID=A0AAD5TLF6_9FUNG|nr:hypothetical protein HDU87_002782 [Geranomyces variabilis]